MAFFRDQSEYIPSFWEDDYCQIEMVSYENESFVKEQVVAINNMFNGVNTEYGFNTIFERGAMPCPTLSMGIQVNTFENELTGLGLPAIKHIRYEGNKIITTAGNTMKAFGFPGFTIFFDVKDELINNIWLSVENVAAAKQPALIISVLYHLGESRGLMLADWNSLEWIDLRNKESIKQYITGDENEQISG